MLDFHKRYERKKKKNFNNSEKKAKIVYIYNRNSRTHKYRIIRQQKETYINCNIEENKRNNICLLYMNLSGGTKTAI